MLQAVIFDMDGVITDNNDFHFESWKLFAEKYGLAMDRSTFDQKVVGKTNSQILEWVFGFELGGEEREYFAYEKEALYRMLYQHHIRPLAGLPELLSSLQAEGLKVGLGTNAPVENIEFTMQHLGIEPFFQMLGHAKMVAQGKPAPDLYLMVAERLGVDPARTVIFEDSLGGGQAGHAAGAKVLGLTTTYSEEELMQSGHFQGTLSDFRQVTPQYLNRLFH